jgi:prepilin-type processing-associated H-X9-DG protein
MAESQIVQRPRRGSAVVTLIVVIGVAAFGVALLLPALNRSRETSKRIQCANNLKQIGLAIALYCNDNRGVYPRTIYQPGDTVIPDVTNAGFDSHNPFAADTTVPVNCVPSALFLLMRTEDITASVFNCASTQCRPDDFGGGAGNAVQRSNFTSLADNLSYSYADPYPDNVAVASGYKLSNSLDAGFPVAADKNPGAGVLDVTLMSDVGQIRSANSHNHNRDGQNVLFADGHVEFDNSVFVGESQDNIYCRGMGGPNAAKTDLINSPKSNTDTVLLPTESN